ncbi:G-protein coupled receptor [Pochonia chlamydosporia 170]|uniref:G-protein coupled receptor n=1 Tax=Pochonia chlamydosporia 170 TaxID=1380566 RepID=A0A179FQF0_METCM|nr:G-protein coupled receptor [Pochonia chlamydosporia 170]OAQ67239.1 G-protein coupled receptor [Pochonia chlamydosporia 170]
MAGNIANRFTAYEFVLMKILPRTSSMLSFLGCLFIITTFSCYKSFRLNPINRIVFNASFGNAIGSICLGIGNIFIHTPNVVKCQLQACMIQTMFTADILWALAMAINVYLVLYHGFESSRLRKIERFYIGLCYGIPFVPSFTLLFIRSGGQRIYGNTFLWCGLVPKKSWITFAAVFGPAWVAIACTLGIYIRAGRTIYKTHQEVRKVRRSISRLASLDQPETVLYKDPVTFSAMGQVEIYQLRGVNHHTSAEAIRAMDTSELKSSIQVQHIVLPPQTGTAASRQSMLHPSQILKNDPNNAIWRYTKAAFLFFTVILITWIPLSAHRAYSTIHVGVVHVPLQLAIGFLGPLQGFWNTIIYIAI